MGCLRIRLSKDIAFIDFISFLYSVCILVEYFLLNVWQGEDRGLLTAVEDWHVKNAESTSLENRDSIGQRNLDEPQSAAEVCVSVA